MLTRKALTLGAFEETFGLSPKTWLEHMTVVSQSCVIVKGTRPPEIPRPGVEPQVVSNPEITEPVAVNVKVLRARLLGLRDRPCDMEGAQAELELLDFPGVAPTKMEGRISLALDRRRMTWPTEPRSDPGPAAVLHLGSTRAGPLEVPVPDRLAASVPCAAGQRGRFSADLAAVPGKDGLDTSILAIWGTPCSPVTMRCKLEARSTVSR